MLAGRNVAAAAPGVRLCGCRGRRPTSCPPSQQVCHALCMSRPLCPMYTSAAQAAAVFADAIQSAYSLAATQPSVNRAAWRGSKLAAASLAPANGALTACANKASYHAPCARSAIGVGCDSGLNPRRLPGPALDEGDITEAQAHGALDSLRALHLCNVAHGDVSLPNFVRCCSTAVPDSSCSSHSSTCCPGC